MGFIALRLVNYLFLREKHSMRLHLFIWITTLFLLTSKGIPVAAQSSEELNLNLSRDFGYSSGTGKIQGTFSMRVSGPENLSRVEFLIDGEIMYETDSTPFRYQFQTGDYPTGVHVLSARGYTSDGNVLSSNERRVEFVTSQESWQQVLKIIVPLFGVIFIVSAASILIPVLTGKGKKESVPLGSPRSYGALGGAICPKCGRPFSIHIYGLNLVIGKLDRCPHCRRWSFVNRASPQELRNAELAELKEIPEVDQDYEDSEETRLRKELDESKYQDI